MSRLHAAAAALYWPRIGGDVVVSVRRSAVLRAHERRAVRAVLPTTRMEAPGVRRAASR